MIELRMLGTLDLKGTDGRAVHSILAQPKRLALLAYLAVHAAGARRDSVIALFWPELDTAHARGALRQSLRFLRRELGDGILNGHSDEAIAFEPATVWCDVVAFEQACKGGQAAQALQLYRGAFLDGCFVSSGSQELERWIAAERTRLGQLAARAAADFVEHAEREGDLPTAVLAARQGVALDPDDESALARLIALLDRSGDRAGALSAFETFRRHVLTEYDATPSPETDARMRAIRARQTPFAEAAPAPGPIARPVVPARHRPWRRVLWRVVGDVVRELQPGALDSIDVRKLHRTTTSADAYLLYLQGRYFLGRRSGESIARARGLFAQAIERDPVYAAAYAGLGYSYVGMA